VKIGDIAGLVSGLGLGPGFSDILLPNRPQKSLQWHRRESRRWCKRRLWETTI